MTSERESAHSQSKAKGCIVGVDQLARSRYLQLLRINLRTTPISSLAVSQWQVWLLLNPSLTVFAYMNVEIRTKLGYISTVALA